MSEDKEHELYVYESKMLNAEKMLSKTSKKRQPERYDFYNWIYNIYKNKVNEIKQGGKRNDKLCGDYKINGMHTR
ncbi:hypothetical protein CPT_Sigurd_056 [Enterococcus phage Sigurd]|nr:hypothetical protein CPT_Sigurd_056 [Enterococcus phage Sigurd]